MTDERPTQTSPEPREPRDEPARRVDDDDTRVVLTSWDAPLVPERR